MEAAASELRLPTSAELRVQLAELRQASECANDVTRRKLVRAFVHQLRVEAPLCVRPTFKVRSCMPPDDDTDDKAEIPYSMAGVRAMEPTWT